MKTLYSEIQNLVNLKQEGSYWDFKREWYDENSKSDLLHDIICMANNLVNRDGYIIIGIDEENNYKPKDVSKDSNRKNTQNIVDFLKDKKFAGDIRPTVVVENISVQEGILDVIVIKNDTNTPYYLKEKYQNVCANQIYTRIQDTNTPKVSSADIDKIEWLWKKRFGLIRTPIERVEIFLGNPKDWVNGPYGEMQKYYKNFPEYTLTYDYASDGRDGYEYYLFSQSDPRPRWMDIKISYHQTLLTEIAGISLDGGRYMAPCPETGNIRFSEVHNKNLSYKYMIKGSFLYKLNEFLYLNERSDEARIARGNFLESIVLFENDQESELFEKYVESNWKNKDKYIPSIHLPHIPQIEGYVEDAFKEEYENALVLNEMIKDYRSQ